jgi:hypothetical protein
MKIKPLIRLWDTVGLGVIILFPSGVNYSNQAGGHSCLQPEAEGVFVPLHDEATEQEKMLYSHFTGPKWGGWCNQYIDDETADFIDNLLELSHHTKILKVDRQRLQDSYESWVYVQIWDQPKEPPVSHNMEQGVGLTASGESWKDSDYIDFPIEGWLYKFYGFGPACGILTWRNSD